MFSHICFTGDICAESLANIFIHLRGTWCTLDLDWMVVSCTSTFPSARGNFRQCFASSASVAQNIYCKKEFQFFFKLRILIFLVLYGEGMWHRLYSSFCENTFIVLSVCVDSEEGNALNIKNSHGMEIQTVFLMVTLQNAACGCGGHCCPLVNPRVMGSLAWWLSPRKLLRSFQRMQALVFSEDIKHHQ